VVLFGNTNNDPNGDAFRPDYVNVFNPGGGYIAHPSKQDWQNGVFPGTTNRPSFSTSGGANTTSNPLVTDPVFGFYYSCSSTNTCNTTVTRGSQSIVGRNSFRGPGYSDLDLSIVKRFGFPRMGAFGENAGLEIRGNLFNALNILNLQPYQLFQNTNPDNNATFGRAAGGLAGRVVELSARFSF
jgi:hypothetical protein